MSRTRVARTTNSVDSRSGRENSLTRVAPGAENRSVIWLPITALWLALSSCSRASRRPIRRAGMTKTGSRSSASTVICQEMQQHRDQRQDQRDDVADHPGQRLGERSLRADHVVVEPADQGAGAGPGEERDRHLQHVVEDRSPQVEDQPLTDPGRQPAQPQPETGLDDGDDRDEDRELQHHGERLRAARSR